MNFWSIGSPVLAVQFRSLSLLLFSILYQFFHSTNRILLLLLFVYIIFNRFCCFAETMPSSNKQTLGEKLAAKHKLEEETEARWVFTGVRRILCITIHITWQYLLFFFFKAQSASSSSFNCVEAQVFKIHQEVFICFLLVLTKGIASPILLSFDSILLSPCHLAGDIINMRCLKLQRSYAKAAPDSTPERLHGQRVQARQLKILYWHLLGILCTGHWNVRTPIPTSLPLSFLISSQSLSYALIQTYSKLPIL